MRPRLHVRFAALPSYKPQLRPSRAGRPTRYLTFEEQHATAICYEYYSIDSCNVFVFVRTTRNCAPSVTPDLRPFLSNVCWKCPGSKRDAYNTIPGTIAGMLNGGSAYIYYCTTVVIITLTARDCTSFCLSQACLAAPQRDRVVGVFGNSVLRYYCMARQLDCSSVSRRSPT